MAEPARAGSAGDPARSVDLLGAIMTAAAACQAAQRELEAAAPGDWRAAAMHGRCTAVLDELMAQLDALAGRLRGPAAGDAVARLLAAGVPPPRGTRGCLSVVPD